MPVIVLPDPATSTPLAPIAPVVPVSVVERSMVTPLVAGSSAMPAMVSARRVSTKCRMELVSADSAMVGAVAAVRSLRSGAAPWDWGRSVDCRVARRPARRAQD
jgi:hypothetical protein